VLAILQNGGLYVRLVEIEGDIGVQRTEFEMRDCGIFIIFWYQFEIESLEFKLLHFLFLADVCPVIDNTCYGLCRADVCGDGLRNLTPKV
jgi:hypothetical protein